MARKWFVRGMLAVAVAATSAIGFTNVPAGASTGYDVLYTTDADFDGGALFNVNHDAPNNNQLQLNTTLTTFPSLWVANAGEDSVSKIDTSLNKETARYRTWFTGSPTHDAFSGPAPSRTAVSAAGDALVTESRVFERRRAAPGHADQDQRDRLCRSQWQWDGRHLG